MLYIHAAKNGAVNMNECSQRSFERCIQAVAPIAEIIYFIGISCSMAHEIHALALKDLAIYGRLQAEILAA
jgi:hypothetical protein